MARPIVALLTDFGLADHYAGTMKAVIVGIAPDVRVIDITHGIPPFDIARGAYELAAASPFFPDGTIFVSVVDPGVGSSRRAVAAEIGAHTFVAPDNGILTEVLERGVCTRAVELREARFALPRVSPTFEGRDRFAPAAAWLATGSDLDLLGPRVDALVRLARPSSRREGPVVCGAVVHVDRFGNAVTSVEASRLDEFDERPGSGGLVVQVGDGSPMPVVAAYSDVPSGAACALVGSSGYVELAVNGGRADERLGAIAGVVVRLLRRVLDA